MNEEEMIKLIEKCKQVGEFENKNKDKFIPITLEQHNQMLKELEDLREQLEKQTKRADKFEEKYKDKYSQYQSINAKYTHLISKNKKEVYNELKEQQYDTLKNDIQKTLEYVYYSKERDLEDAFNEKVEMEVLKRQYDIDTYSNIILKEIEQAYTDYLENSDNESERATGYLIALRKFQKISRETIKKLQHNNYKII